MNSPRDPESLSRPEPVLVPVVRYGSPGEDAAFYRYIQDLCAERAASTFQRDMASALEPFRPRLYGLS